MIPLIDLKKQYLSIKDEIDATVARVLDECRFILGPDLKTFEAAMAKYLGVKYAVGVASGTDALEIALFALDLGPGDEVITPPFTFIATSEAIYNTGARPVFVDIDKDTYCINPDLIEEKITPKTKAIVPVHLYGYPADMDKILKLAKKHNLKVIEDCAQSLGAAINGVKVGSLGDLGALSFFPGKNLGCYGDGGMVVTNDSALFEKAKMLRHHGSKKKYFHSISGFNSRLDTLQAAILNVKLKYLDKWNEQRRKNAERYARGLKGSDAVTSNPQAGVTHSFNYYTIRIKDREKVQTALKAAAIGNMVYYPLSLHLQEVYQELGYKKGDFPETEKAQAEVLSLPMFAELLPEQIDEVVKIVRENI